MITTNYFIFKVNDLFQLNKLIFQNNARAATINLTEDLSKASHLFTIHKMKRDV